jgi:hypothetical protein
LLGSRGEKVREMDGDLGLCCQGRAEISAAKKQNEPKKIIPVCRRRILNIISKTKRGRIFVIIYFFSQNLEFSANK